ncbi:MAG: hypothetical protein EA357_08005 [Micavibrio sp.]|nr:MAG: hypothetical protein EA357_08005 [Micavibrio sp.]
MMQRALIAAVKANDFQQVYSLLESSADVHERDEDGMTALHHAVGTQCNNINIINLLLKSGADVHAVAKTGAPLDIAVRHPMGLHAVQALLAAGANPNFASKPGQYEKQTSLHYAAVYGTTKIIALLIKKGADPNRLDGVGNAPLHWAVSRYEAVEALLSCGARATICGPSGITPLHALVTMGDERANIATAELLIGKGASVNAADRLLKQTPLHIAAQEGAYMMCRTLIKNGAKTLLKDAYGKLPGQLVPEKDRHIFESFAAGNLDGPEADKMLLKKPDYHLRAHFLHFLE